MQSRLASAISLVGRETLRIVLPSWCVACQRELPWRARKASCCQDCWGALEKFAEAKCNSCAMPLRFVIPSGVEGPGWVEGTSHAPPSTRIPRLTLGMTYVHCIDCAKDPLPLDWCDAWGEYQGVLERLLHALKFQRHDFLADALSSLLEETLRTRGDLAFDALVAVPMHAAKERRRGYNQAELLARALSRRVGLRCDMTLLVRKPSRATQSTLPKRERAENVRGTFAATPNVKDRSILIVDDICTTGETLRACAETLLAAGAARVAAITVAKAS